MIQVDKLIGELKKYADWEPPDSPRSKAMREAAEALTVAKKIIADSTPTDDDKLMAKSYRIETSEEYSQLRIYLFNDRAQRNTLGYLQCESAEVYDLGTSLLKHYDKLEGIK